MRVNRSKAVGLDNRLLSYHPAPAKNRKAPYSPGTYLLSRRIAAPIHTGVLSVTPARILVKFGGERGTCTPSAVSDGPFQCEWTPVTRPVHSPL